METPQGSPAPGQSADPGQGSPNAGQSAIVSPNEVPEQYIVPQTPATPPAVPQEQGQTQGQSAQPIQADANELIRLRNVQAEADRRLAENYRLQAELQRLSQERQQVQRQPQVNQNPYDPQTQWDKWLEWKIDNGLNTAAEKASQNTLNQVLQFAQKQQAQQQEMSWQQAHPGVDINLVKQWGQMNGVNNLDHAFTLMNMNNMLQSATMQGVQNTYKQFQQPQNVATPVRGGQQAGGTIQLSYDAMAKEFTESNGRAYETWSPALREAFDRETYRRDQASR